MGGTVYLQDISDRMNSTVTVLIMSIISILISYKTYFMSPMECFTSNTPSGTNFENYVTTFCWVAGTTVFELDEAIPDKWDSSDYRNINYYPWIPIIVGIQCAFFSFPKLLWKEFCFSKSGTDLQNIIERCIEAARASMANRQELIKDIAGIIETLFHYHRDNRHGVVSDTKRKMSKQYPLLIWGKRSGNSILGFYLVIKFLYIAIAMGQLFLMAKVLQLDNSFWAVFYEIFNYIFHGYPWKATKYFPRVTFCQITDVRSLGNFPNKYVSQCVLPINILNEKICIFLLIWIIFLLSLSIVYFLKWIVLIGFFSQKKKMIKVYLKGRNFYKLTDEAYVAKFILEFLRHDGIFLIKMMRLHSGDVLTGAIVEQLWIIYKTKYRGVDLSNPEPSIQFENLALRLEPGGQKATMKTNQLLPSAPKSDKMMSGFL